MPDIIRKSSPNHEPRRGGVKPDMLIIHYTGTSTAEEAASVYMNERTDTGAGRISPHYMIDRNGAVYQFVDEERRAWHAGKSYWQGERDINSRSIGIELVNPGHENGYRPFPEVQMESLIRLCKEILQRHEIRKENILGHSDVSPGRKFDPGELFDWKRLSGEGIGIWPEETMEEAFDVDNKLLMLGYDPETVFDDRLHAFQQHYAQEATGQKEGRGMKLTRRRLAGLAGAG